MEPASMESDERLERQAVATAGAGDQRPVINGRRLPMGYG